MAETARDGGIYRPVRELDPEVARKIAAGEVIDRPAAVIRELLDNAIDSGASRIAVDITGGGIESIRVSDNGCGMTAEDLVLCAHTHTTSKIAREDDLLALTTLGFRGEALSSINAVSRLDITTTRNGREAWRLIDGRIEPSRRDSGTAVGISGLFENFPARRQFLKRPASESALCRQTFIEKALAWPGIEFRLTVEGKTKDILPPEKTYRNRWLAAMAPKEPDTLFHEISGTGNGFGFSLVVGGPDVIRSDRRDLMIFVNGRRIQEFGLIQAIEYGTEGHFPNGTHPAGALFVTLDPALVDFNIHPAKREARFRDAGAIHHGVSQTVRDFFRRYTIALVERTGSVTDGQSPFALDSLSPEGFGPKPLEYRSSSGFAPIDGLSRNPHANPESRRFGDFAAFTASDSAYSHWPEKAVSDTPLPFRYLGQALGTFILVEKDDAVIAIDQHAAHERILYDELVANSGQSQELLIPYTVFASDQENDRSIDERREELRAAGFTLERSGEGFWEVTSVPLRWTGTEADVRSVLSETSLPAQSLISKLYAGAACKAACKDGDILDPLSARNLAAKALALKEPRCPHGRPVWTRIDRAELFARVQRT